VLRIAAVIPTYNRARLLERTLESIVSQTRPADEIVVVDDGSTDDTADVVARFAPAVTYVYQENAGASAARNHGVEVASADFVAFLDSDDVWSPDFLARIGGAIEATEGRALTYFTDLSYTDDDVTAWQASQFAIEGDYEFRDDASDWFLLPAQPMTTQAAVIRRDAYLDLGGQDRSILCRQDTHLFLRLGFAGPACAVAGVGGWLTADGEEERLTNIHSPARSLSFWQDSVVMYRDVLRSCRGISRSQSRVLSRYLAIAYWRLSRIAWRERRLGKFVVEAARSLACSPGFVARVLAGRLRAATTT
jgi:glycosyltransferase involved in cell wall biosynthesis